MDKNLYKKPETPDFGNPNVQKTFVDEAHASAELLQKEIEVNKTEQVLLEKRIQMMQEFSNDLPASDPQYSMLLASIQMDRIEIDELKLRETILVQELTEMY